MLGANEFPLRQGFRLWRKRLCGANAPPRSAGPHPAPASFSSTQDSSEIPCLARIPALRRDSMPDEEFLRFQLRSAPLGSQLVCRPAGGIFAVAEISILTVSSSSEKALRRREKPQGFFHAPDGFFFASQARPAVLGPQLGAALETTLSMDTGNNQWQPRAQSTSGGPVWFVWRLLVRAGLSHSAGMRNPRISPVMRGHAVLRAEAVGPAAIYTQTRIFKPNIHQTEELRPCHCVPAAAAAYNRAGQKHGLLRARPGRNC